MSKKGDEKAAKGKGGEDAKKDKKDKKDKKGDAGGNVASIAGHPRARAAVRRCKGWGGLIGFVIAGYLSYKAGVPTAQAALRALGAGIVGYILAWVCAVTVWRQLVIAEFRASYEAANRPAAESDPGSRSA